MTENQPFVALLRKVADMVRAQGMFQSVTTDVTPPTDKKAAGLAESAVKSVKDKCRVVWNDARARHGVTDMGNHAEILAWCVRYSAQLYNTCFITTRKAISRIVQSRVSRSLILNWYPGEARYIS